MKLIRKYSKDGKLFNAIVSHASNGRPLYDFDPIKIKFALHIANPDKVNALMDEFQLTYPAELLRSTLPWVIEI